MKVRYPLRDAAAMLSISERQLNRLRADGKIVARRDGGRLYIDHDELVSYAKSVPAEEPS